MKATVVLTFIVTCVSIIRIYNRSFNFDKEFCNKIWVNDREHRYVFVDKIIKEKRLIGLSKEEVLSILGFEFNDPHSDVWTYYVGVKPGFFTLRKKLLYIYFNKNDSVYLVRNS